MDENTSKRYRLLIVRDSSVRTVILDGNRWLVGRASECDISLRDNAVSRKQLILERDKDVFRFKDLGGTNHALLNGRPTRTGVLPIGGTLLIGMTRLTLDILADKVEVQMVGDPMQTCMVFRHYLDTREQKAVPIQTTGQTEAIAGFLERLMAASADFDSEEEVAKSYLDALLSQSRHKTGIIARFRGETLTPLASISGDDSKRVNIPTTVVQELLTRPRAIYLRDQNAPEQSMIFVPMGKDPGGMVMITNPADSAPPGTECLRLTSTLAPIIWSRIIETNHKSSMRKELEQLRSSRREANTLVLGSSRLIPIRKRLLELASLKTPIQLLGEAGTEGPELAQFLHAQSPRSGKPFVSFFAQGLSLSQAETELIGNYDNSTDSAILRAQGGTLYIDMPSALPAHLQEQLASIIRTGLFDRPGQNKTAVDIRFIFGCREVDGIQSSPDLSPQLIEQCGQPIIIPPLRSSTEDIFALAEQFLEDMGPGPNGTLRAFTDTAKMALVGYHWPENVRELRQALETAAARAGSQPVAPRHLPKVVTQPAPDSRQPNLSTLDEIEKRYIITVLEATQGNRAMASRILGVATSTLYHKMKRFKLGSIAEPQRRN